MPDTIASTIKSIRENAGDSPATAAKKVGVSRQGYVKWELGDTKNMKLGNLLTFCDKYHVGVEDLIRGTVVIDEAHQTHGPNQHTLVLPEVKIAYSSTPAATTLSVQEPNPDIQLLIEGFRVAEYGLQRGMLALAKEALETFERRSGQNN